MRAKWSSGNRSFSILNKVPGGIFHSGSSKVSAVAVSMRLFCWREMMARNIIPSDLEDWYMMDPEIQANGRAIQDRQERLDFFRQYINTSVLKPPYSIHKEFHYSFNKRAFLRKHVLKELILIEYNHWFLNN